ncbi:MAG TPA: glycosyltransferase family 2 protein [Terriglobales bacterium]
MKWLFWTSLSIILYTYFGFPLWLWLRRTLRPRRPTRSSCTPQISIVMVVRNEAEILRRKLENLLHLDYPPELVQIIVVSDGSTDGTEVILHEYGKTQRVDSLIKPIAQGKAAGLNDARQLAHGEIIVLTDARQMLEIQSVRLLMEGFAEPSAGCVSGDLMLGDPISGESGKGTGLYWSFEKKIREAESATGSVVGATGAFYAVRKSLLVAPPPGTILDDVYIPMQVARSGARVSFDARAKAWDSPDLGRNREFKRKVRTLTGNYQLLQLAPWLLTRENPLRFEFISHKLFRLLIPFALAGLLVASAALHGTIYRTALAAQLAVYGLSLLAMVRLRLGIVSRAADAAHTFVFLNTAALVAFINFITRRKPAWG